MKKIQQLEEGKEPTRRDEPDQVFDKPIFTNLLTGPSELWEGQKAHFEARVVPVGDPTMRYLWFCNGVELKMGKLGDCCQQNTRSSWNFLQECLLNILYHLSQP